MKENRECILLNNNIDEISYCSRIPINSSKIKKIGEGGFGKVYAFNTVIDGKTKSLVLKVIEETIDNNEKKLIKDFYHEIEYSIKMGEYDIVPKIYDAFYYIKNDKIYQNIIMERFDISIGKWLESKLYPSGAKYIVDNMLKLLYIQVFKKHMYCTDIKPQNYVLKINNSGKPEKVRMIDFGADWCSKEIPSIYITYKSLRLYNEKQHDISFYVICVIQLFMFLLYSFNNKIKKAIHILKHFYTHNFFNNYVVERGKKYGLNMMMILYDVLETEKEQAEIFKHYLNDYSNDNEELVKIIFNVIDNIKNIL